MLNAIHKFWAAAAWSNFQNLAMIGTLILWHWFPNAALAAAWGVLIGGILQLFFILWAGAREGLWLKIVWPRWTPDVREFFIAFGAVTFGAASLVISPFIDTIIASFLPVGSRGALYLADRINQFPLGVLGVALGTVLLPEMSARLAKGDLAGSAAAQNRSAAMSLLLTLPFAAVFLAIPGTIMRAVFVHGAFDAKAAGLAATALWAYGVGLPAMALLRIVQSTFYARHDTATPVRATITAIASNILLKVVFVWGLHLGVAGVALGTSLGAWINVAILTWFGKSRALLAIERQFIQALLPVLIAAIAAGAGAWIGVWLTAPLAEGKFVDMTALAGALIMSIAAYGTVVLLFHRALPLRSR
jgi:putative peptidoglycan lipid II flippase